MADRGHSEAGGREVEEPTSRSRPPVSAVRFLFLHKMFYQDPLGFMYLSAVLKEAGHEVHFIDAGLDPEWEEKAVALAPDVVGYSVITGNSDFFLEANHRLKARMDFLSLWGGPHPTFFPEWIEEEGVDALCIGEGEGAIVDLADTLQAGGDITSIANLHVKTDDGVVRNCPRHLIQDLDSIPFPDRGLIEGYPQYKYASGRAVIASRGCPYKCTFCFNSRWQEIYKGKGRYTRFRSVDNIVEECLRHADDPWVETILFKDDLFAIQKTFVAEFSEVYGRRVGLPFIANVRADRLTEEMVVQLAGAGARVLQFGIESGNERVRKEILGRDMKREVLVRAGRWLRDNGIKAYTYNIVGIPGETPEEAMETLELNAEVGADMAVFTLFQPWSGTPLAEKAFEMGWSDPGYAGFKSSYYDNNMSNLPHAKTFMRMVRLFPLASRSPLLRKLTPTLIRLPLGPLYAAADFVYKATRFIFTLGMVSLRDIALFSGKWVPRHPPVRRLSAGRPPAAQKGSTNALPARNER